MPMVIKNNRSATNTLNTLNRNEKALSKSLKQVSTGMKITGAQDDASGYAISERMRVQIQGLSQSDNNAQTGLSMLKTAEGAVDSTVEILRTLKEKLINAANDTNTDADREIIQKEFDQMIDQIDDNANSTYNGKYLVDGSKNRLIATATFTSLTNHGLSQNTTFNTRLGDLEDAAGNSLEIQDTARLVVSYVKQGKTYTITKEAPITGLNLRGIFQGTNDDGTSITNDIKIHQYADPRTHRFDFTHVGVGPSGEAVHTVDGRNAITFVAVQSGVDGQIAGLTFCFMDMSEPVSA